MLAVGHREISSQEIYICHQLHGKNHDSSHSRIDWDFSNLTDDVTSFSSEV